MSLDYLGPGLINSYVDQALKKSFLRKATVSHCDLILLSADLTQTAATLATIYRSNPHHFLEATVTEGMDSQSALSDLTTLRWPKVRGLFEVSKGFRECVVASEMKRNNVTDRQTFFQGLAKSRVEERKAQDLAEEHFLNGIALGLCDPLLVKNLYNFGLAPQYVEMWQSARLAGLYVPDSDAQVPYEEFVAGKKNMIVTWAELVRTEFYDHLK